MVNLRSKIHHPLSLLIVTMPHWLMALSEWKPSSFLALYGLVGGLVAHVFVIKGYTVQNDVFDLEMFKSVLAICALLLGMRILRWYFFERLQTNSVESIQMRTRATIMDSIYATTLYRHEGTYVFATFVTILLVVKCLHVYVINRISMFEEEPLSPRNEHIRHVCLIVVLFFLDIHLVFESMNYYFNAKRDSMLALFIFEFVIRLIELTSQLLRYIFHAIDVRMEGRWNGKGSCTYYNELIADSTSLIVYLALFVYLSNFQAFPFYVGIEFSATFSRFRSCLTNFFRYRRVVLKMDEIFSDATQQDLTADNNICSICRDEMHEASKLECGHIFHKSCLQSWLKLQLVCPVCRVNVKGLGQADAAFRGARGYYEFGFTREDVLFAADFHVMNQQNT